MHGTLTGDTQKFVFKLHALDRAKNRCQLSDAEMDCLQTKLNVGNYYVKGYGTKPGTHKIWCTLNFRNYMLVVDFRVNPVEIITLGQTEFSLGLPEAVIKRNNVARNRRAQKKK